MAAGDPPVVLVVGCLDGLDSNDPTTRRLPSRNGAAVDHHIFASGVPFWATGVVLVLGCWCIVVHLAWVVAVRGFGVPPSPASSGRLDARVAWAFLPSWFGVLGLLPAVGPWIAGALWVWASEVFVAAVRAALDVSLARAAAVAATVAGIVVAAMLGLMLLLAMLA